MHFVSSEGGPAVPSLGTRAMPLTPRKPRVILLGGLLLERSYCSDWDRLSNPTLASRGHGVAKARSTGLLRPFPDSGETTLVKSKACIRSEPSRAGFPGWDLKWGGEYPALGQELIFMGGSTCQSL